MEKKPIHSKKKSRNHVWSYFSHFVWCSEERRERNVLFCREFIVLPGACFNTYFNSAPIYHLYIYSICRNFIPSQILSSNIISSFILKFIYNAKGIFINRGSFIFYVLLQGTSKAFTLSVFLTDVRVHIILPKTRRILCFLCWCSWL